MKYYFELKIIDDYFSIDHCPIDWKVDERGSIFHRVYYVYSGFAVYEGNNQSVELKKGHIYVFPANRAYRINQDPNEPLKCLWFHVTISPVILNPIINFDITQNIIASNLIKTIVSAVESELDKTNSKILIEQLLNSLLYLIGLSENFVILNNENLNNIIAYIHTNYMKSITNQSLCMFCGYDKSYFIRLFEKVLGVSPQKYLLNYRMSMAVGLIKNNIPISEVAFKVGYTDSKAFCRAFKRAKGIPPSKYDRSHYLQP